MQSNLACIVDRLNMIKQQRGKHATCTTSASAREHWIDHSESFQSRRFGEQMGTKVSDYLWFTKFIKILQMKAPSRGMSHHVRPPATSSRTKALGTAEGDIYLAPRCTKYPAKQNSYKFMLHMLHCFLLSIISILICLVQPLKRWDFSVLQAKHSWHLQHLTGFSNRIKARCLST